MAIKVSLFSKVRNHILDTLLGKRYYFVLLQYNTRRVRSSDATVPPIPLCETSSNIFFTYGEALEYYNRFHSDDPSEYLSAVEIVPFRSRHQMPHWSLYADIEHVKLGHKSLFV